MLENSSTGGVWHECQQQAASKWIPGGTRPLERASERHYTAVTGTAGRKITEQTATCVS